MKQPTTKIFKIDNQLEHIEISPDEVDKDKRVNTLHFIEISYNPVAYKSGYTYFSFKAYDTFFKPSCLKVGNIKAMGTRDSTWIKEWDASQHYNIYEGGDFWEIGPQFHRATYEILIQDVNYKNKIISFSRPNKNATKNAINPIIKCLKKMKELNEWGTWKALELAKDVEALQRKNAKIEKENILLKQENQELMKLVSKIAKEEKAIKRLNKKVLESASFLKNCKVK